MQKLIQELNQVFKDISEVKLAFSVGSFGKKYFCKLSDLDIVIIVDKESFDLTLKLSKIRRILSKKYNIEIDFMLNSTLELTSNSNLGVMNYYVLQNYLNGEYYIFKNNLITFKKTKKSSELAVQFGMRYYFEKIRNILLGQSLFMKTRSKLIIGKDRTKVCSSCMFSICKLAILKLDNKLVVEYKDIINWYLLNNNQLGVFLMDLWDAKRLGKNLNKKQLSEIYFWSNKIYSKSL
jgi:predicted nucleotidyltransferase